MSMLWIKLYTKILHDYEFHQLDNSLAYLTIALMLVAADVTSNPEPDFAFARVKSHPRPPKTMFRATENRLCESLHATPGAVRAGFQALAKRKVFSESRMVSILPGLKFYEWRFSKHYRSLFSIGVDRLVGAEWQELRAVVLERDSNTCQYCGEPAEHIDHIIPICKGGGNELDNLVAACTFCNCSKGGRTPQEAGMELRHV